MTDGTAGAGFFFIRHGQTTANRDGVRSGAESDTHMTELGREQVRRAGRILHDLDVTPGLILCSPLSRTIETANLLNTRLALDVRIESGLVERRLGDWNGQSIEATRIPLAAARRRPAANRTPRSRPVCSPPFVVSRRSGRDGP